MAVEKAALDPACILRVYYLDDYLLDTLMAHEKSATLDSVGRLVQVIRPGDAVVTFNYDRLVERCLTERGSEWTFGMIAGGKSGTVPVLKMHGSLDWICFARDQRREREGVRLLFSKPDVNREREEGVPARSGEEEYDLELFQIVGDDRLGEYIKGRHIIQSDHRWGLAGLGPQKRVSQVPGLGVVWERARQELFHADHIVVVGFSFSGYDRLAQIEFARVMAGREADGQPAPRVTVIDPALRPEVSGLSDPGRALLARVESVFRPASAVGMRHEEFDWHTLP